MDRWTDRWMDGWAGRLRDEWTDVCMYVCTYVWMDMLKALSTLEKSVQQPRAVSGAPDNPESHTWDFPFSHLT